MGAAPVVLARLAPGKWRQPAQPPSAGGDLAGHPV